MYDQKKSRIIFAVILAVICCIVGGVSGAVSSVMVFKLLPANEINPSGTDSIIYVPEEPSGDTVPETTEQSTKEPETTAAPPTTSISKSKIYYDAVNSAVIITSRYDVVYKGLFGSAFKRNYVASGSGFFISDNGYIATNYHVVKENQELTVTTFDDKEYPATLAGYDENNDVAVLKIDAKSTPVTLGCSSDMSVGDDIMVLGNALGDLSYTFTDGLISYTNRKVQTDTGYTINMFQTNAAINSGNSGGPVYNMNGEVIGIASAKFASAEIEGLCFFIPIDDIKDTLLTIAYG